MKAKKGKISQVQIVSYIMIAIGLFTLLASLLSNSSIPTIIGLGLSFWGALLLYIKPESSPRKDLTEASVTPSLITLDQLVQELGYKGDTVYLPPRYFTSPEIIRMCITKDKSGNLPTPEQTRLCENTYMGLAPQAILLTPSGVQLSKLLEKELGQDFTKTTLENLQRKLPKIFIEDYEIAERLEIETAENTIIDTTTTFIGKTLYKQGQSHMPYCHKCGTQLDTDSRFCHVCGTPVVATSTSPPRNLPPQAVPSNAGKNTVILARITRPIDGLVPKANSSVDYPIFSAIGIAVTKATGKPVIIVGIETSENGDILEADYLIMEK